MLDRGFEQGGGLILVNRRSRAVRIKIKIHEPFIMHATNSMRR